MLTFYNNELNNLEILDRDFNGSYINENGELIKLKDPDTIYTIQSNGNTFNIPQNNDANNIIKVSATEGNYTVNGRETGAFAALKSDGTVYIWGNILLGGNNTYNNNERYLKDNDDNIINNCVKIFSNNAAFAALLNDGSVFVWGDPQNGGANTYNQSDDPIDLYRGYLNDVNENPIKNIHTIYGTFGAFAGLTHDNTVYIWGNELLGGSNTNVRSKPSLLKDINDNIIGNVKKIYSTYRAFAALLNDGLVFVWGDPTLGGSQQYNTQKGYIKIDINTKLSNVKHIYSTYGAFAALLGDGSVFVWGNPKYGASNIYNENPQSNINYSGYIDDANGRIYGFKKIYSHYTAFAGIVNNNTNSNTVFVWGNPTNGGANRNTDNKASYIIENDNNTKLNNVIKIWGNTLPDPIIYNYFIDNTGSFVALKSDGSVFVWGSPSNGGTNNYIGDNTDQLYLNDAKRGYIKIDDNIITIFTKIIQIQISFSGLTNDGKIITWGYNGGYNNPSPLYILDEQDNIIGDFYDMYSTLTDFIFLRRNNNPYVIGDFQTNYTQFNLPTRYKSIYVISNMCAVTLVIQENKASNIMILRAIENTKVNLHKNIVEKANELGVEYIYCQ